MRQVDYGDIHDPVYMTRPQEAEWPEWVEGFRDHQVPAIRDVLDAYDRGVDIVFLDAPTGAGKTLIAEAVRRAMGVRAVYMCHGKELQAQFVADYPYSRVLMGRSNYDTELRPDLSAEDCTGNGCGFCVEGRVTCPYQNAKRRASTAPLAVLNTAYFLAEANIPRSVFAGRKLVVADESDTLEGQLMGHVEFRVSSRLMRDLRIQGVVKAARVKTIKGWLTEELRPAIVEKRRGLRAQGQLFGGDDVGLNREIQRLTRLHGRIGDVVAGLVDEEAGEDGGDAWGDWVRDYDDRAAGDLILKPVRVSSQGAELLWPHGDKWLCMSASLISPEEQAESLGIDRAGLTWETVTVPMTFPVENRPIFYRPKANITAKTRDEETPKLVAGIAELVDEHPDVNVLIHTVNYSLAGTLSRALEPEDGRPVWTYANARERAAALEDFKAKGGVLVAPSMDRGVDLAEDLARLVIIAKIPFPYLGDKQVSVRMRTPGGPTWYACQVARSLVQMTGRGVRSEVDVCQTYIVDAQFSRYWQADGRRLLPKYWRDAVC